MLSRFIYKLTDRYAQSLNYTFFSKTFYKIYFNYLHEGVAHIENHCVQLYVWFLHVIYVCRSLDYLIIKKKSTKIIKFASPQHISQLFA